jgi:hypothetical protein
MLHLPETLNKIQCPLIGFFKMSQALYKSKSGFQNPRRLPLPTISRVHTLFCWKLKSTMIHIDILWTILDQSLNNTFNMLKFHLNNSNIQTHIKVKFRRIQQLASYPKCWRSTFSKLLPKFISNITNAIWSKLSSSFFF